MPYDLQPLRNVAISILVRKPSRVSLFVQSFIVLVWIRLLEDLAGSQGLTCLKLH